MGPRQRGPFLEGEIDRVDDRLDHQPELMRAGLGEAVREVGGCQAWGELYAGLRGVEADQTGDAEDGSVQPDRRELDGIEPSRELGVVVEEVEQSRAVAEPRNAASTRLTGQAGLCISDFRVLTTACRSRAL